MVISLQAVVQTVIYLIIAGAVFGLLWWLIGYVGMPEPFNKFARVFLAVCAVLILIGLLLNMAGTPMVRFAP